MLSLNLGTQSNLHVDENVSTNLEAQGILHRVLKDGICEAGAKGGGCRAELQGTVFQLIVSFLVLSFVLSQDGLCDGWFVQPSIVVVSVLGVWRAGCASWHCSQTLRTHSSKQLLTKNKKAGLAVQLVNNSRYRAAGPQNGSHGTRGPWGSHLTCSQEPLFRVRSLSLFRPRFVLSVRSDDAYLIGLWGESTGEIRGDVCRLSSAMQILAGL